jgi:hypothetical protein
MNGKYLEDKYILGPGGTFTKVFNPHWLQKDTDLAAKCQLSLLRYVAFAKKARN